MKKRENRVAHSKPSNFSLGQMYEFAAEFGRQSGNPDLLQKLIENKAKMIRVIAVARGDGLPKGYELAALILGDDFITPEKVAKAYGKRYSDEQLKHLAESLPTEKALQWYRIHGYMLVPGPPKEMNLLEVRDLNKNFYSQNNGWYAESNQKFATDETVKSGEWLAIRKDEVPSSFNKTWRRQQELLAEDEHVPNATEVSYAVTVYHKIHGIYLLHDKYVRTTSVSAEGNHVFVGGFDENGLVFIHYWDKCRFDCFGIASKK